MNYLRNITAAVSALLDGFGESTAQLRLYSLLHSSILSFHVQSFPIILQYLYRVHTFIVSQLQSLRVTW